MGRQCGNLPPYLQQQQQQPPFPLSPVTTPFLAAARRPEKAKQAREHVVQSQLYMEGNSGAGASATPWDLGMHWAPTTTAYPHQPFLPPPDGPSQQELTCLKLGKRPCCWGGIGQQVVQGGAGHVHGRGGGGGAAAAEGKRKEKTAAAAAVPRCQVEGCHLALAGAKEYHRRHKVCEAHSKAPRVIVHGAEQRFCQQCSRFHAISEFDDAKRSCRRRLAGHNERRRKSNASEAMTRGSAHPHGITSLVHGFPPYGTLPTSPAGALSLLSSARAAPWLIPTPDISARSSAALDELIAENRAALLSWHVFTDRSAGRPAPTGRVPAEMAGWHARLQAPAGHVTLDLMQATNTTTGAPFRPAPDRPATARPAKDGDAGCSSDVWTSLEGARVV